MNILFQRPKINPKNRSQKSDVRTPGVFLPAEMRQEPSPLHLSEETSFVRIKKLFEFS